VIRISVSDLDSFLYWRESEDGDLGELTTRLAGYQAETDNMRAGKALKTFFSRAQEGEVLNATVDGIQFVFAIDEEIALPAMLEHRGERVFPTRSGPAKLVGKVDSMEGTTITQFKLTETFDAERLIDSIQWRAYLSILNAERFDYQVFVGKYDTNRDGSLRITIRDYHRFPLYAYPGMVNDVHEAVGGLAEIIARCMPGRVAA
jgi:hypothetical protein